MLKNTAFVCHVNHIYSSIFFHKFSENTPCRAACISLDFINQAVLPVCFPVDWLPIILTMMQYGSRLIFVVSAATNDGVVAITYLPSPYLAPTNLRGYRSLILKICCITYLYLVPIEISLAFICTYIPYADWPFL